jgi:hypothetical protein
VNVRRHCHLILILFATLLPAPVVRGDDPSKLEVHEWSVWVGESQGKAINSLSDYTSAMPGIVETERSRRRDATKPGPTPMSVMTLYGEPPEVVDLDLRISAGRPLAQWPRSEGKSNRLRWLDLKVTKQPDNPDALVQVPEGHWFYQARNLGGLYVQMKKSARIERFLTYDLELQTTLTIRLDGGPDQFKVANLGKHPLRDVLLIVPSADGRRLGWLENVPPAPGGGSTPNNPPGGAAPQRPQATGGNPADQPKPAETVVDCPLSESLKPDSEEYRQQTSGEFRKRLTAAGMSEAEVELLLSLHAAQMFGSDETQLVFRMSPEALDEIAPLTVEPETAKVKRVALIVARSVDPRLREDIDKLIQELGDATFAIRERAEQRLRELGRLAVPKLKEAIKNKDLEVVVRAERLLLAQKEQLGAE